MKVICYGDSNTYGFDPRSYFGSRYGSDCRWVDILADRTGWCVQNYGMNGRQIPDKDDSIPSDTDLLIVMLGTNDLLQGKDPVSIMEKMDRFLQSLLVPPEKLLLIAPPVLAQGLWVTDQKLIQKSLQMSVRYQILAQKRGIPFLNAADWKIPLSFDGVHFTEAGNQIFAEKLMEAISE